MDLYEEVAEENKIAEFASAYVYARPVEPMTSYYNWEEVTMEVTLEDPTLPFVVTETEGGNGLMFQVTPTEDIFENIYQDYIPVKVNIKLTDKYGNVIISSVIPILPVVNLIPCFIYG